STTTYGAAASLTFEGSEVFLYGGTGPNHGQFKVQLDNQQPFELNGTAPMQHPQTELVRNQTHFSTDLMGSDDSQTAAMRSYSNRHNPSGQSAPTSSEDAHTNQVQTDISRQGRGQGPNL
ncbi:hypothetical protein FRC10_001224, partial [Ceratobasidium sp. 414]